MNDGIPMDAPAQPSRRARQRARRAKAAAEGKCQGKNRRGKPCKLTAKEGSSVCWRHGANGGRPILHGRFSETLQGRLRASCQSSLNDGSLFDHAQTCALLDSLVKEACAQLAELDCPRFRASALERAISVRELITLEKDPKLALRGLIELLERGIAEAAAQERVFRLAERLDARLAEANRLKLSKQNAINSVDLVGVMQALLAAIQRLAPPDVAKLIADELAKILGGIDVTPPAEPIAASRN